MDDSRDGVEFLFSSLKPRRNPRLFASAPQGSIKLYPFLADIYEALYFHSCFTFLHRTKPRKALKFLLHLPVKTELNNYLRVAKQTDMQSILIADDHDIVRFGLTMMLKDFFPDYTVDEAWDAESVIEQLRKKEYQLILLDLVMPNTDASILLPYIKNIHPIVKVLILSMNDETLYGLRSIHLGAHGYLKKDAPKKEIAKAIRTILAGKKYVSQELADSLLQHSLDGKSISPFERLSPREFQVAMYLIKDFTQKQISEKLQVQYGTVNTLKQRIYDKLEIGERKELNELASVYGLQ